MNPLTTLQAAVGRRLARFLAAPHHTHGTSPPTPLRRLAAALRPGDVLLVEGQSRVSTAIKYLTQSTWSHAALYVGEHGKGRLASPDHCFVEADLVEGVRGVGLDEFAKYHTRICRPIGLTEQECAAVTNHVLNRIGHQYDLRNMIDLARYLLPAPPVPERFRRRLISFGSGDPTRAICSTMIAQAFESIRYPVLPYTETQAAPTFECPGCVDEVYRIRDHSLYAPRDFDVSPYFRLVKPSLEADFDFHTMIWRDAG